MLSAATSFRTWGALTTIPCVHALLDRWGVCGGQRQRHGHARRPRCVRLIGGLREHVEGLSSRTEPPFRGGFERRRPPNTMITTPPARCDCWLTTTAPLFKRDARGVFSHGVPDGSRRFFSPSLSPSCWLTHDVSLL